MPLLPAYDVGFQALYLNSQNLPFYRSSQLQPIISTPMLHAEWTDDVNGLLGSAQAAEQWDRISGGVPFRQASWLHAWWKHCADDAVARIVTVRDANRNLVAALPLYQRVEDRPRQLLRSMADGKACSDHVSLLFDRNQQDDHTDLVHAVVDHLIDSSCHHDHGWQSIVLDGVIETDEVMSDLVARIRQRTGVVHAASRMHTWYRGCAETFDQYLLTFSRSSRGKQRRLLKSFEKWSDPSIDEPHDTADVHRLLDELIEVHQTRWVEAGETGSFDQPQFRAFMNDTAARFAASGKLWIVGLRESGKLVSAAMSIIGEDGRAYCYCTATDMNAGTLQAGKLLTLMLIQQAHERGLAGIDFLRGDELYKARLHAEPSKVLELRIAAPSMRSRLRHTAWLTAFEAKQLVRKSLGRKTIDVVSPV